jgi:hypothetical protein
MADHTPTPWRVANGVDIQGPPDTHALDYTSVAGGRGRLLGIAEANAHFIVRACNAHAGLVAALQALADKVDATSDCDHKRQRCEDIGCIGAEVRAARAALAKARGEST